MSMYGWIASTPDFDNKIKSPQTLSLLKKFSYSEGKAAYKFGLGDVVDTHNDAGSYDHTVWIEIYERESNTKVCEISTEVSDKQVGIMGSSSIMLAASLDQLGFLDEETINEQPAESLLEAEPHSANVHMAQVLLSAVSNALIKRPSRLSSSIICLDSFIKTGNSIN